MAEEFTAKFKVDISDLKKNISDANKQIKLANAEFNAATAGMDDWAKSADGISAKLNQLDKTLAAQKSVMASYQDQLDRQQKAYEENGKRADELRAKLKELADKGVSENSDEYKKYVKELSDAEKEQAKSAEAIDKTKIALLNQEAAVGKTEKEIRQYNDKLDDLDENNKDAARSAGDLAKETDKAADEMDDLGKATDKAGDEMDDMSKKKAKLLKGAFVALGAAVVAAVAAMGKLIVDSAEAADSLGDMSKKTGLSVEALQTYKYQADMTGSSLETITGAQAKLVKTMQSAAKGTGTAAETFKKLGVQVTNADGSLRKADDVFMDAIDSLGKISNETERDAAAMEIFGKSAQELNPLIKEGKAGLQAYADEAHELGIVVSDDVIGTLGDTATELKKVRAQFDATKQNIAAEFAPIVTAGLKDVQKILVDFNEVLKDPEVQAAIDQFTSRLTDELFPAISELFRGVDGAGAKVGDAISNLLTDLIDKIVEATPDLVSLGANLVVSLLEGIISQTPNILAKIPEILGSVFSAILQFGEKGKKKLIDQASKTARDYRDEVSKITDGAREIGEAYDSTVEKTTLAYDEAKKLITRLKELEKQTSLTADEETEYHTIISNIKSLMPGLNIELNEQTGYLKDGAEALEKQVESWKDKAMFQAIENRLTKAYEKQLELKEKINEAQDKFHESYGDYVRMAELAEEYGDKLIEYKKRSKDYAEELAAVAASGNDAGDSFSEAAKAMLELDQISEKVTGTGFGKDSLEAAKTAANEYGAAMNDLTFENANIINNNMALVSEYERLQETLTDGVTPSTEEADGAMEGLDETMQATGKTTEEADGAMEGLDETMQATGKTAEELAEEHFSKVVSSVQDMFNEINTKTETSMKKIIETLKHNGEALTEYQENLRTIQERGASENVMKYLESLGVEQAGVIKLIAESTDKQFEKFTKQFDENTKKAEKAGKEWGEMLAKGVEQGVDKKLPDLKKIGKKAAHAVADAFKDILLIASPSKLFKKFGLFTGEGYIIGLKQIIPRMGLTGEKAATTVADKFRGGLRKLFPTDGTGAFRGGAWASAAAAAMNGFSGGYGSGSYTVNNGGARSVNFTQVINAPKTPSRWELYRQTRNLLDYKVGGAG